MFPPETALRHPLVQPIFQRRKPRPREGCGLAQGGDRVPIPKTLSRGRGGADCRHPLGQRPVPASFLTACFSYFAYRSRGRACDVSAPRPFSWLLKMVYGLSL